MSAHNDGYVRRLNGLWVHARFGDADMLTVVGGFSFSPKKFHDVEKLIASSAPVFECIATCLYLFFAPANTDA